MRQFHLFLTIALLLVAGCGKNTGDVANKGSGDRTKPSLVQRPGPDLPEAQQSIVRANFSEELILNLSPRLKDFLKHATGDADGQFSYAIDKVTCVGLADTKLPVEKVGAITPGAVEHFAWPLSESKQTENLAADVWGPLLKLGTLESAKFGVTRGTLLEDRDAFVMETVFESRFRPHGDPMVGGVKAKQELTWVLVDGDWKIEKWKQKKFDLLLSPRNVFVNRTREAVDAEVLKILTDSKLEDLVLQRAKNSEVMASYDIALQFFADWTSLFQYPSASVVDVDQDGHDDLFITDRYGPTLLLRNKGDGTFEDATDASGLTQKRAFTNCAIFADFDNDGDPDLFLGRSIGPSFYLRNEDGRFVPDEKTNEQLATVRFVSAASAVDVNNDGLLDLYLSTYTTRSGDDFRWTQYAVPPRLQDLFLKRVNGSHPFVDRRGPPNIMLMNKNGVLTQTPLEESAQQWRNSFQSVWTDYDDDGDLDVYICNDFAPDVFLRNETERGSYQPKFSDVTFDIFKGNTMGFGMGANFGDYNSDGTLDLYVSNMYSKAGHRVVGHFGGDVDERIKVSAKGNFLYRFKDGQFEHVAGLEPGKQQVAKVGWSFGGQFSDFNNDGKLDLYVPSGFFTAPDSIADEVDL